MRTKLSPLLLLAASSLVAAQAHLSSSSLNYSSNPTSISTRFITVLTTVTVTRTTPPPITVTLPSSTTTTTLFLTSPSPQTATTTIHTNPHPPSSTPSGTLISVPTSGSRSLAQNPGALAGLIIGLCAIVTGLVVFAWFTIKRHQLRELEAQAIDPSMIGPTGRGASSHGHSRIIDDEPDLEIQSSVGHEMRRSSTSHAVVSSLSAILDPGEGSEQRDGFEGGFLTRNPTAASSVGHSSHGHGTINSSLTQVYASTRNTSPTFSRQVPNRTRFSLGPDRSATIPSAWQTARSEAPTRRGSVDDVSTISHNPHRVSSEPVFHDALQPMSIYPRRLSSDVPRPEMFPHPGPSILVHTPPPIPPSSLLRPPSATQVPTLETLRRSQPPVVCLTTPSLSEPHPSPAGSNVSVRSGREGLLATPPHHPTESLSSFKDELDYSRRISIGVVSGLRDSTSMADPDSDSDVNANQDLNHRRSTLG